MAGPARAEAPPCEGTYEYFFGKSFVNVAPGNALPDAGRIAQAYNNREGWVGQTIRKPQSEGFFEMEVNQCGREFVISQGGKSMLFVQSANDDTTYVAQNIGIESGSLTMRVIGHKVFVGKVEGVTQGFKYTFPVAMEPRGTSMPDLEGCDDEAVVSSDTFAQEKTATRGFLAARGMTPPAEYAPGDYFRALETERDLAGTARDGSTRHIRFRMGRNNAILPEIGMREICQAGPGKLDPPRRVLNFKIFRVEGPDGFLVFAQEIDIETGKILGQAEGESIGRGAPALQGAMKDAATALEANGTVIGPLSDGIMP
ncbi:hypothetical protein ACEWPM_004740 [Roseovarius sp. S4756]|uniref:hypothetical protein n=1 Tax=Roseovarius maritimus TaxID=3342637 RepID=UPI0037296047